MSAPPLAQVSLLLFLAMHLFLPVPSSAMAAVDMEELLPPVTCGAGWMIEAKPVFYDQDTLSDRINGEAELYFPYGFDRLAAARYTPERQSAGGIDVEIFRMGSPLDAFGMFANYRRKEGSTINAGAGSNLSGSQIVLFQGRHFIHIQMTGTDAADQGVLADCARSVASRLPAGRNRPPELSVFDRPEVIKDTERYLPRSLLGYDFLNSGIMADAVVDGTSLQVFFLLAATTGSASTAFDHYRSLLARGKVEPEGIRAVTLEGIDPLYGPVMVLKNGNCLTGALKFRDKKGIRALLESFCR